MDLPPEVMQAYLDAVPEHMDHVVKTCLEHKCVPLVILASNGTSTPVFMPCLPGIPEELTAAIIRGVASRLPA